MNSKELQIQFEQLIEELVLPLGFEIFLNQDDGEKYYCRAINNGQEKIIFIFGHYGKMLSIKPQIGIYIDDIGDIYKKNSKIKNRPIRCIGNHLLEIERYIEKGEETERVYVNHRWKVRTVQDLIELAKLYKAYFNNIIDPYFKENGTVARVDELLNKEPRVPSIHNNLNPFRACIAIIAARINENSRFKNLLAIYDESIKKGEESYQADYQNIRQFLLNESSNKQ